MAIFKREFRSWKFLKQRKKTSDIAFKEDGLSKEGKVVALNDSISYDMKKALEEKAKGALELSKKNYEEWYLSYKYKGDYKGRHFHHISETTNMADATNQIFDILNKKQKEASIFIFDNVSFVMQNNDFLDFVIEHEIVFSAVKGTEVAEDYCNSLHYLIEKKNTPPHNADEYAKKIGQKIYEFHQSGKLTLQEKADALKEAEILTANGHDEWGTATVRNVILRWQELTGNKFDIENTYSNKSEDFANTVGPIIKNLELEGFITLQAKADELNQRKISTYRGKYNWKVSSVKNVQQKYETLRNTGKLQNLNNSFD